MTSGDWNTDAARLYASGKTDAAVALVMRAAQRAGDDVVEVFSVARSLGLYGQFDRALYYGQRAIELTPDNPVCWRAVHDLYSRAGRHAEMLASAKRSVVACPKSSGLWMDVAAPQLDLGDSEQALESVRHAIACEPMSWIAAQAQLMAHNYLWPPDTEAIKAALAHAEVCARLDAEKLPIAPNPKGPTNRPARDKPLVVFVSPDCYVHSVAFFLLPLLEHADPARATVWVFYTGVKQDAVTARIKAACQRLGGDLLLSAPDEVFEPIKTLTQRHGPIDIAVDLAGLTPNNSVNCFARGIAPRQATYLGYPNSTGQPSIGVRIVDAITDPVGGLTDGLGPERLVRLPGCFLCYQPPAIAPAVAPSLTASGSGGGITFGSFNNACKLNHATVDLWSRVLAAVPNSRLLLKCAKDVSANLALYNRVDIALDTLGYTGTATTCEALYMGVPVLTCMPAEALHAGRVSASLLTAAGVPELITTSVDEFVHTAASLAGDRPRLATYRATLRARLLASPLCDAKTFARNWFDAILDEQSWVRP